MSISLDPDQARHFVGPDLGPNCLQILSADDTSKQRIKVDLVFGKVNFCQGTHKWLKYAIVQTNILLATQEKDHAQLKYFIIVLAFIHYFAETIYINFFENLV